MSWFGPITHVQVNNDDVKVKIDEKILECAICHDQFEYPYTIPCGHTFCRKCLIRLSIVANVVDNYGELKCPLCQELWTRPQAVFNRALNELIEVSEPKQGDPDYEEPVPERTATLAFPKLEAPGAPQKKRRQ